jgi:phage/plasmid-like protein (TIGR03299 family)
VHNLATTNGKIAMMYVGEPPWHKLGTRLDSPATAEDAIVAAGLNYEVQLADMTTVHGLPVPQRKAVLRADTNAVLGVVSDRYVPVQNRDAFGFLNAIVTEGGIRYHTAGALGNGERIWLLAKLPDHIRVRNTDDLVEKYLLLSNSHDGSTALRVFFTPIRVVCQNTLNVAERRGENQGIAIRHRGDLPAKIREAQRVLGLAERFYDDAAAKIDILASHFPTSAQLKRYFESLYPDPEEGKNNRARNIRKQLHQLFEHGVGQDISGIQHTTWAALNAVTELIDHRPMGDGQEKLSRRVKSVWFGSGARMKAKAWNLAVNMATSN